MFETSPPQPSPPAKSAGGEGVYSMENIYMISQLMDKLPLCITRFIFNLWPPFRGMRIKVAYISPDFRTFDVVMKLGLFNRNYAGVHFGGALFTMSDPFYMLILAKNLGEGYIVWDKAARIDFIKPARGTVHAHCAFSEEEINAVRQQADSMEKYVFDRPLDLVNDQNEVVARVVKTLYVRRKVQVGSV